MTEDGPEPDLGIGHYYRFTNAPLWRGANVTAGQSESGVVMIVARANEGPGSEVFWLKWVRL